jgi:hypothetical protein
MSTHASAWSNWLRRIRGGAETDESESASAASTTGGGQEVEPVVVWEAANRMEAEVVKGRLESEGIPAFVRAEAAGTYLGLTTGGLAAAEVLVPAPLAEKALEILATEVEWDDESDSAPDPDAAPDPNTPPDASA